VARESCTGGPGELHWWPGRAFPIAENVVKAKLRLGVCRSGISSKPPRNLYNEMK